MLSDASVPRKAPRASSSVDERSDRPGGLKMTKAKSPGVTEAFHRRAGRHPERATAISVPIAARIVA